MSTILVIAEHQDGAPKKSTLQSINFAHQLAARTGGTIDLAVIGAGAASVAAKLVVYGAQTVYTVEGAGVEKYLAQPYTDVVMGLIEASGATTVVATSSTFGKDLLPRVAAATGWGMVADCTALTGDSEVLYKRPMYAGNVLATVRCTTAGTIVAIRAAEFDAAAAIGSSLSPVQSVELAVDPGGSSFVGFEGVASERPDLGEADVVVAGGRGLKDGENFFSVMNPMADALGAAIGASRAAVDSGFCPNDMQVGQTGKVVAPALYFAVAISGAIQHLAGMKNSKCIVAINKDPDAPIFQVSDYGLVADAFKAVPEFVEKL
jgi:electron transfer flavoprotein alpha subunit